MRWWLFGWFCLRALYGPAQTTLHVTVADAEASSWKRLSYQQRHVDSTSAAREASRLVESLRQQAYAASADQVVYRHDSLLVRLYIGPRFDFFLAPGNVLEPTLRAWGYQFLDGKLARFSYQHWVKLSERALTHAENTGYPFASLRLDSVRTKNDSTRASIQYQSGPLIRFDSLLLSGNARVKPAFLRVYLDLIPRRPFSQEKVARVAQRLAQLPYLKLSQPPSVRFFEDKAYVALALQARKTNQFDGIIGFLPNQQAAGKLLITGEVKLQLNNLFGMGRGLRLHWQQIRPASPVLHLSYSHPTLFHTSLELKGQVDLLKQDTSFFNTERSLRLSYPWGKASNISASVGLKTSRLTNSAQYRDASQLPAYSDVSYLSYGLGYEWNTLDDYFYPRRGFRLVLRGEAGNKKILKNPFLNSQLYEGLALQTLQASVQMVGQQYWSISRKSVVLLRLQTAKVASSRLFTNELFRLGGLNSLRGFNENFFFASAYVVGTLEYQFFTEERTYLLLCYDQGWLSTPKAGGQLWEAPAGAGTGINFSTRAGAFTLVYSMGRFSQQSFGFNKANIHFGFVSIF